MSHEKPLVVAAVQASPVFMDLKASVEKAIALLSEAARNGANLAVFPEAFLPGYPLWAWFIPASKTHPLRSLYARLHSQSVHVPGEAVQRLADAAAELEIGIVMGVNEINSEASGSSLFNSLVYIGSDGSLLGKHRKMIPTSGERLIWSQAAACDLEVYSMDWARVGGLICWENYMPLARHVLTAKGQTIHCAPTWDRGEPWMSTVKHVAKEGRCFAVSACQYFTMDDIPDSFDFKQDHMAGMGQVINPGLSLIVDPDGKVLAGPAEGETILYASLTSDMIQGPRWQLDTAGHYSRPDIFRLSVETGDRPQIG